MANYKHSLINTENGVLVLPRIDSSDELAFGAPVPDIRAESATQLFPIGTALLTDNGVFRYAKNGAAAVTIGKLLQNAAVLHADFDNDLAMAAASVGDLTVTITNTASAAITKDYFKDGWLNINDCGAGTGEGGLYKVKSHPAAAKSASCVLTLVDPIEVALTTASQCGLIKNLYDMVIVSPATTQTGIPVGVPWVSSFTAAYFGWIKTKGLASVLTNGTIIIGRAVAPGLTVAGSVDTYPITLSAATPDTYVPGDTHVVGIALQIAADTEYSLVKLDLDPTW